MSGLGEYFTEPVSGLGEYFTEPVSGLGEYVESANTDAVQAAAGLGATAIDRFGRAPAPRVGIARYSPLLGALGQATEAIEQKKNGLVVFGPDGQPVSRTTIFAVLAVGLAVRGGLGYMAGKAMTPSGSKESTWAWTGVAAAIFGGTLGLGIQGAVALSKK